MNVVVVVVLAAAEKVFAIEDRNVADDREDPILLSAAGRWKDISG